MTKCDGQAKQGDERSRGLAAVPLVLPHIDPWFMLQQRCFCNRATAHCSPPQPATTAQPSPPPPAAHVQTVVAPKPTQPTAAHRSPPRPPQTLPPAAHSRADCRRASHGLARLQVPHKVVVRQHALHTAQAAWTGSDGVKLSGSGHDGCEQTANAACCMLHGRQVQTQD